MRFNRAQTGDLDQRARDACDELRRRLRAGEACHVEDVLTAYPSFSSDPAFVVPLIHAEWDVRVERGERPSLPEWLERFPQWRHRLEPYFHLPASEVDIPTLTAPSELKSDGRATRAIEASGQAIEACAAPLTAHEVGDEIGRGSMGVVYRAFDKVLNRTVALKKISLHLVKNPVAVARFYQEARAAAQLNHPHIVAVYVMGLLDGRHCFTMPLVPTSLDQQRTQFAEPRAIGELIRKIAEAVHAAHERGIVHRDLKPSNILLDERGEPLVADFGLAVLLDDPASSFRKREGTPAYMSPEQTAHGEGEVGPGCDVWALGVMLYEFLAGKRPFSAKTPEELGEFIRRSEPPSLRTQRPGLDQRLEAIVGKCLAKEPQLRYATAQALADDLAAWLEDRPGIAWKETWGRRLVRVARRRSMLVALTLAALTLAVAAWVAPALLPREDPDAREVARLQQLLDNGKEATWKTEKGKLPRLKPILGGATIVVADDTPDALQVTTGDDTCLVEMLPALPSGSWLFRASVRTVSALHGQAGLYFAHHADGNAHSFLSVALSDQGVLGNQCQGAVHSFVGTDNSKNLFEAAFNPLPLGQWHLLAVEVRPNSIRVQRDGQLDGVFTPESLAQGAHARPAQPFFPPLGGVGLYLSLTSARFKDIAIQPLPLIPE